MSFDYPLILWAIPAAAIVFAALGWLARRRRIRAARTWSAALGAEAARGWGGPWVMALAGAVVVAGVAGPRWGRADVSTETRALNVVFALDVSRSMLAEDASPSRLGRAIRETRRLVQDARGDRMALLGFAGRSYILTPLTLDDGAMELQLDALDPDIASEGGTDLAQVLRQGGELLEAASEGGARAMVVFTDGEGHDSVELVHAAARHLKELGVTLIVVGEGGPGPARIPLRDEAGRLIEYKKDADGKEVATQRNDELLKSIADQAQGILVPADFADQAGAVWRTLAGLDRDPATGRRTADLVPRAWVAALGVFLLLLIQAAARRRAALIALAALSLLPPGASAQRPATGFTRLRAGDTTRAVRAFAEDAVGRAGGADTSAYNAGTVALRAGQLDLARQALEAAGNSVDPRLRFQALYNAGLLAWAEARRDSARRDELKQEAAGRFRDALLLDPGSTDAKWNLELVSRRRPPPPPSASKPKSQPKGGSGPRPQSGLSPSEVEQILRSVERTEQGVRSDQVRRRRLAKSAADKDW